MKLQSWKKGKEKHPEYFEDNVTLQFRIRAAVSGISLSSTKIVKCFHVKKTTL